MQGTLAGVLKIDAEHYYCVKVSEFDQDEAPDIEKRINKKLVNEELNRIKNLYNYHSKDYFNTTTSISRMQENREFSDMIGKARKLLK